MGQGSLLAYVEAEVMVEPEVIEPGGDSDSLERCLSLLAYCFKCAEAGWPTTAAGIEEVGLYEACSARYGASRGRTASAKRWERDGRRLAAIGFRTNYSHEKMRYEPTWSPLPASEDPAWPLPIRRLLKAVRTILRLQEGPAGLGELCEMVGAKPREMESMLSRLMMVGVTPYAPHDYYGIARVGGVVEMFSGPRIWR